MHAMRAWLMVAVVALAMPVAAQDVRPESLKLYGGTYSTDCGNSAAPRLVISADALAIEHGPRRTASRGVMDSYTSFGAAPTSPIPPGYVMEFLSGDFSFHVFQDKAGLYIQPSAYVPAAEPVIGKANMKTRFRRCGVPAR
jgi:hypothetical protein